MKKIAIIMLLFCISLGRAQEQEPTYTIKNLASNGILSNFGTTFYGKDKLVFSSPAKRSFIINNLWTGNDQPFLELYVGTITEDGGLNDIEKFSNLVNTRFHEADVTFSKDKKTMYFTRSNYHERRYRKDSLGINRLKMYKATLRTDGQWGNVSCMPFSDDEYSVGHPTLSEDQKTLYFISDMPGTLGETDIFKVAVHSNGTYGKPENLGPEINTPKKEMFPYISGNDELYFSTDGREGLGMLDIYMSKLGANGAISTTHLGEPMNSDRDDFALIINHETLKGYFSSNRYQGHGDDDIYSFNKVLPIICNQFVNGIVKDKKTGMLLPGSLVHLFKDNVKIDSLTITVDKEAVFKFPLDCESTYRIEGTKENYLKAIVVLDTDDEDEKVNKIVLALEPDEDFIVIGDKVILKIETIYFEFDKAIITEDSAIELDKAIKIMKKYPDLIVEFGAHCDSRGPDSYNDKLSSRRANSTVEYMINNGISSSSLTGRGYGESKLTNKCSNRVKCTEEEHQKNRRTEFVITNPEILNINK